MHTRVSIWRYGTEKVPGAKGYFCGARDQEIFGSSIIEARERGRAEVVASVAKGRHAAHGHARE